MAHSEQTKTSTVPQTHVGKWNVEMHPRNLPPTQDRAVHVEVMATSKQEAINKAISQKPGHTWGEVTPLNASAALAEPHILVQNGLPITGGDDTHVHQTEEPGLWSEAWKPQVMEGEEITLSTIVHQAIGTGSMCWEPIPSGTFDSTKAEWVAGGAINEIEKYVFRKTGYQPGGQWPAAGGPEEQLQRDIALSETDDADIWASEFCRVYPQADYGSMIGWFANAMQAACTIGDERNAKLREKHEARRKMEEAEAAAAYEECAPMEIGQAEEPAEAREWRIRRDADKAAVVELILSYRNVASDEEKLRQIRVVMD